MKIIVGLGNPGEKYTNTRHNAGFLALDFFLKDKETISCQSKFKAQICELRHPVFPLLEKEGLGGVKLLFVKPETFMNLSGTAVKAIAEFYKIDPAKELLVIHDDTDLPLGTFRVTESCSAAGHNGVQNIIDELGTQNFHRIRIGVETRASRNDLPTDAFVLQNFSADDLSQLQLDILPKVALEIQKFIAN